MKIPFTKWEIRKEQRPRPEPWDDFWYQRQPYESLTGIDVNEDNALTYAAVWACVKVISEDLASLPLHIYRRDGSSKERASDHPLYYLLHDAPNPEMTKMQFVEALQGHLLTFGNAYAEIVRNLRGEILGLWPLNPARMTVTRPEKEIVYEYREETGKKVIFSRDDILHVAGLGFNGLIGYSPVGYMRETIACGMAAQEWQATNYKEGGALQLVFVHPGGSVANTAAPNAEGRNRIREELRKEYGGRRGHRIGATFEGMKPEKLSMTMEDAQFLESRKFTRSEISGMFRVPAHKIGDLERATFSNIEQQALEYVTDAIRPWCTRWEQAINQRLLNGSGRFFAEHNMEGLLRGDIASRYSAYAVGRNWGWLSVNDIRERENMNPVEGGDVRLQPLNMTELGSMPEAPPADENAPVTDEEKEQAVRMIRKLRLIRS